MAFEGSEKRIEIEFALSGVVGLRQISRSQLDQLMKLTCCTIISSRHNDWVDAYVLSESSLFVLKNSMILKTCGSTRILNGLGYLLSLTEEMGMRVCRVKYSRASFLFPQKQHYPHQKFDAEVTELNKYFSHLQGASYVLGNQSRGLQWHLFYAAEKGQMQQTSSVEICLTGMRPDLAQQFVQTESFVSARTTTYKTGIANLMPAALVDDYVFEPCGYSMNGLSENGLLTVHVTPEEESSYASVEFSCLSPNAVLLDVVLVQVLQIFEPKEIHISLHSASSQDLGFFKGMQRCLPGYSSDGVTVQYLADGSAVIFKANQLHHPEPLGILNPSPSFSSRSDDISSCDSCILEDLRSVQTSMEKTLWSPKKYSIQDLGVVDMRSYFQELIQTQKLQQTFYVVNLSTVQRLCQAWRHLLSRVEPFYAVKCNPDPVMTRLLASEGCGFDCASSEEIKQVMELGIPSSKIIFANACKHPVDVHAAEKLGVNLTTFDTVSELEKIKCHAPSMRTLLRIRADDPEARCLLGNKYGAQTFSWPELFQKAKDLGVWVVGISFHVGSGATNPGAFSCAIYLARQAFDMGREHGFSMTILDIGGGFCSGRLEEGLSEFHSVSEAVNRALDQYFPPISGVRIIAEPGRYFAETAATLACYVLGRRERQRASGELLRDYWITDGLYGSFNCILYDHSSPKTVPLRVLPNKRTFYASGYYSSTIFGPTCDGLDTVAGDCILPELFPGDWLLFPDMGAYTLAGASNFNGMNATDVKVYYVFADFEDTF